MRQRLRAEHAYDGEQRAATTRWCVNWAWLIAIETLAANTHYEVPGSFFEAHLGPRLKYSCGYYSRGDETLSQAEDAMLALRAAQTASACSTSGCGWGSLSLWLAERYPAAQIVGLSNSHGQRHFIEQCAAQRGLTNLRIVTGNVVEFDFDPRTPVSTACSRSRCSST